MKIISMLIFFSVVFVINVVLNMLMDLGQSLPYIFILSIITTILFYILTLMRNRWS